MNGQWEVADVTESHASRACSPSAVLEVNRVNKRPVKYSEPTEYTAEEWTGQYS